jgi:hypothetical protein
MKKLEISKRFSKTTMRNKYHLRNHLVMAYIAGIPSAEVSNHKYGLYRKTLRNLCGNANCREFRNANACLDAKLISK